MTTSKILLRAATLEFAMLRFAQEDAHARHGASVSAQERQPGIDDFTFLPSWMSLPRDEVVPFLASLPCPALIYPSTMRGAAALLLLDELSGERKAWGQKTLSNQRAGVDEMAAQFFPVLQDDAPILLEMPDEAHIVTLEAVRFWSARFSCPVGWNIAEPRAGAPPDVHAQIRLFAMDGRVNPPSLAFGPFRPGW